MDHKVERRGRTGDLFQIWYDSLSWSDGKTRIESFKLEKFPTAIGTFQLRLKIRTFWLVDISSYTLKVDVSPI